MQHEDTEPWDSVMAQLVGLGGGLLPLFAGLDGRYDWPGLWPDGGDHYTGSDPGRFCTWIVGVS